MPTQEERNEVAIEVARVKGFLNYNQLVQAHGIAQKIESMIRDVMVRESQDSKIEDHPWWGTLKKARLLKEKIFVGNPKNEPLYSCPECDKKLPIDPGQAFNLLNDLGASI